MQKSMNTGFNYHYTTLQGSEDSSLMIIGGYSLEPEFCRLSAISLRTFE